MPAHVDLSGQVIHGVTVLAVSHVDARHAYHYRCLCRCGKKIVADGDRIKRDLASCGCRARALEHGRVNTPEYRTWAAMKARCLNPNVVAYPDYGGRGIRVCERWMDFKLFYADMGDKPSPRHQIERINNNGHYEPRNCCWATSAEQSKNRRSNVTPHCVICGARFVRHRKLQQCCSHKCAGKYRATHR